MNKLKRAIVKMLIVFSSFLAVDKALAQELDNLFVKAPTELVKEIKELNFLIKETQEIPKRFRNRRLDDQKLKEILDSILKEIALSEGVYNEIPAAIEPVFKESDKETKEFLLKRVREQQTLIKQKIEDLKDLYQLLYYAYFYQLNENAIEKMFTSESINDLLSVMDHFDNMHIYWVHLVNSKVHTKALEDVKDSLIDYLKQEMIKDMTIIVEQFEKVNKGEYTYVDYEWMMELIKVFGRGTVFRSDKYLHDKYYQYREILRSAGYQ